MGMILLNLSLEITDGFLGIDVNLYADENERVRKTKRLA